MSAHDDPRLVSGPAGSVVHAVDSPALGRVTFQVLDPDAHLDLLHEWVTRPTSAFWGMAGHSREQVRDVYRYVDGLPTHHAFLVRRDGLPIVLLQTYEPDADPVGEVYDALPGDAGLHFLLGDRGPRVARFTSHVGDAVFAFLFSRPSVDRLVIEPDADNERAVDRARKSGFELGPHVELPGKTGRLAFLTRARWEASRA